MSTRFYSFVSQAFQRTTRSLGSIWLSAQFLVLRTTHERKLVRRIILDRQIEAYGASKFVDRSMSVEWHFSIYLTRFP